jgi:hypothetical protein
MISTYHQEDSQSTKFHCTRTYGPIIDINNLDILDPYLDFSNNFHEFKLIFTPFLIAIYIDDIQIDVRYKFFDITQSYPIICSDPEQSAIELLSKLVEFPNDNMHMIFNVGVEKGDNGPRPEDVFPSNFVIDYIKYYKPISCIQDIIHLDGNNSITQSDPLSYNSFVSKKVELSNISIGFPPPGDLLLTSSNMPISLDDASIPGEDEYDQLLVVARDEIEMNNEVEIIGNERIEFKLDPFLCNNVPGYLGGRFSSIESNNSESFPTFTDISLNKFMRQPHFNSHTYSDSVNIFPNPTQGFITISSRELNSIVYINIFNIQGQAVFSEQHDFNDFIKLDLNSMASGFYILELSNSYHHLIHRIKLIKK